MADAPKWLIDMALAKTNGSAPEHLRDYKSTGVGADIDPSDLPGRSDDELRKLLEASRTKGKWHASMLSATASMIGRGWSDSAIRLACAPYCDGGADDPDLGPLIASARRKWSKPGEEDKTQSPPPNDEGVDQGSQTTFDLFWHGKKYDRELRPWLVKGLIFENGTGLASGQWGAAKTFSVLDLAGSIITGTPFAGREVVRQGGVLFVAAEGASEIPIRLKEWSSRS